MNLFLKKKTLISRRRVNYDFLQTTYLLIVRPLSGSPNCLLQLVDILKHIYRSEMPDLVAVRIILSL